MSLFVFFISLLIVAQHVSGNHVSIIMSWRLRDVIASCWYVPWLQGGCQDRLVGSASYSLDVRMCSLFVALNRTALHVNFIQLVYTRCIKIILTKLRSDFPTSGLWKPSYQQRAANTQFSRHSPIKCWIQHMRILNLMCGWPCIVIQCG